MIECNNNVGFEISARVEESMFEASLGYWPVLGINENKIWVICNACREHYVKRPRISDINIGLL